MSGAPRPAPSLLDRVVARATESRLRTDAARTLARHAMADTLACMIAGRAEAATRAVASAQGALAGLAGPCRVAGGLRAPPFAAARINGTAAHALDYDDNFAPGVTHASAVLVPALLAIADARALSPDAVLESYLVGLEAQAEIGRLVTREHYAAGWHATGTVGCVGSAAGTAHLLGLDSAATVQAMSLATSLASGIKGQFGSAAKPFHAGMAAANAVEAAFLAQAGLTGRADILERPEGFLQMFGAPGACPAPEGDAPHSVEATGLAPKRHPCCGSTHPAIDALLDLRATTGFAPDDVAGIAVRVGYANFRNLPYHAPRSGNEARFSMPYCLAGALRHGRLALSDFDDSTVLCRRDDPLLARVAMTHHDRAAERAAPGRALPHEIEVTLSDGTVLRGTRRQAKGMRDEPFTDADRRAKFDDCVAWAGAAEVIRFDDVLRAFDGGDISALDPLFC